MNKILLKIKNFFLKDKNTLLIEENKSEWNQMSLFPNRINKEQILLYKHKNNINSVFVSKYNHNQEGFLSNAGNPLKKEKIIEWLVVSVKDLKWETKKVDLKNHAKYIVEFGDKMYAEAFLMDTGNRYGVTLCFSGSGDRIYSPKRWLEIPS